MKRILTVILLSVCCICNAQDDLVSGILSKLEGSRVMFDFSYTVISGVEITSSGTAILQGDCFFAVSDQGKLFCNGESRWTIDEASKEVYIEPAIGAKDFLSQPDYYLKNVYDLQTAEDSFKGVFVEPSTGVEISFVISGILYLPANDDKSLFTFNTDTLPSGWVVTDLR